MWIFSRETESLIKIIIFSCYSSQKVHSLILTEELMIMLIMRIIWRRLVAKSPRPTQRKAWQNFTREWLPSLILGNVHNGEMMDNLTIIVKLFNYIYYNRLSCKISWNFTWNSAYEAVGWKSLIRWYFGYRAGCFFLTNHQWIILILNLWLWNKASVSFLECTFKYGQLPKLHDIVFVWMTDNKDFLIMYMGRWQFVE